MGLNKSIDAELGRAYLILQGSITAEGELKDRLTAIGFTVPVLTAAHDLYVEAGGQRIAAFVEHGEQLKATFDLNTQRALVDRQYSLLAQTSRAVFVNRADVLAALGLQEHHSTGPISDDPNAPPAPPKRDSRAQAAVVGRAKQLYSGLIAQPDLVAELAPLGYPAQRLERELTDVTTLENADVAQEREKGEAQGAKAKQKAALAELKTWVRRFNGIVVPALSDRPDLLSMLGLKPKGKR